MTQSVFAWLLVAGLGAGVGAPPGDRLGPELPPERAPMRHVPAGTTEIGRHRSTQEVRLPAFDVDARPVKEKDYRVCVTYGACPDDWPVTGAGALAYCRFAGKRLPNQTEWPIAAKALRAGDEVVWLVGFGDPMPSLDTKLTADIRCVR